MHWHNLSTTAALLSAVLVDDVVSEQSHDFAATYNASIQGILADINEERRSIFAKGAWTGVRNWSPITDLMNSAYFIAIEATKKLHLDYDDIPEFETLNRGLRLLNKRFSTRNLSVEVVNDALKIHFKKHEFYHSNHEEMDRSGLTLSFVPIWGLLYNANYGNARVVREFAAACEARNPIGTMLAYARALALRVAARPTSSTAAVALLLQLERRAADDRLHFYSLAVLHAECLALSQKTLLAARNPKSLTSLVQLVVIALNTLQKKYLTAANYINVHAEL